MQDKKANLGMTFSGDIFVGDVLKDGITISSNAKFIDESQFLYVLVEFLNRKIGNKKGLKIENSKFVCEIEMKLKFKE
ncbi:MAG: hypothetical protein ACRCVH_09615 [Vagococcus fluvialis]